MNIPLPFVVRRAFHRRKRRQSLPVGGEGLAIVGVTTTGSEIIINFSDSVTWDGSTVPSSFQAFTTDGDWQSVINVLGTGASWIRVEFNAGVDVGAGWALTGPMEGITPAIAWPQNGTVA